jgi:hypothetical protein
MTIHFFISLNKHSVLKIKMKRQNKTKFRKRFIFWKEKKFCGRKDCGQSCPRGISAFNKDAAIPRQWPQDHGDRMSL